MHLMAALSYPNIDPTAIAIGPIEIKWYGLAYMAGLLLGWLYVRRLLATPSLWKDARAPLAVDRADDLLLFMTFAVIVGGRLGQVLLYEPSYYFAHPAEILKTWHGGMSFHGAVVASAAVIFYFAHRFKVSVRTVMDLCCAASPFGIFFGRIANFINSEHWGRITDASIGMVFPNGGPEPRHPSQLYEAMLEGLVLAIVMRIMTHRALGLKRPGLVGGVWLVGYALARTVCEFFREPEAVNAFNIEPFTAGQIYSLPMLLLGIYFIASSRRQARMEQPSA